MEIERVGEFAAYCQDNRDDQEFAANVTFVENWADQAKAACAQFGRPMDEMVDFATPKTGLTPERFNIACDVLGHFWKHSEAFNQWLGSKVIIVTDNEQQTITTTKQPSSLSTNHNNTPSWTVSAHPADDTDLNNHGSFMGDS